MDTVERRRDAPGKLGRGCKTIARERLKVNIAMPTKDVDFMTKKIVMDSRVFFDESLKIVMGGLSSSKCEGIEVSKAWQYWRRSFLYGMGG